MSEPDIGAAGGEDARPPRVRRARGARESLGSVVLGFESIVVFLGGLVVYGLNALPEGIASWWGIVAGTALAVLMILTAGLLRHSWAIAVGWGLQVVVLLGGILVPALVIVALVFGALWAYGTIKGASLDARNARIAASTDPSNGE
ncbi:hypothetical protein GCM10009808_06460 [Microbacterium sediminicola]|uniref:DUF4233 domain-containing protein n=1 Tax=Microbacterium sediminicola TaxID=415210 RepID=A0ABN2HR93_9MICO